MQHDGPFTSASLRGTYSWFQVSSGAGEPIPNEFASGLVFYDGAGNHVGASMYVNDPGDTDADGNPTRNIRRIPTDPATWSRFSGTVEVTANGVIVWSWERDEDVHYGVPMRTEMIDGVLTITEYKVIPSWRGLSVFEHARIADADVVPPAAEE